MKFLASRKCLVLHLYGISLVFRGVSPVADGRSGQNQGRSPERVWTAAGRALEPIGDDRPREMIAHAGKPAGQNSDYSPAPRFECQESEKRQLRSSIEGRGYASGDHANRLRYACQCAWAWE